MKWYVVEVVDSVLSDKPLRGAQHRLLINEKWEVKPEARSTEQIIEAAAAKYPDAESRYTSRYFGFTEPWLNTLDRAVAKHLKVPENKLMGISIEIVARIWVR